MSGYARALALISALVFLACGAFAFALLASNGPIDLGMGRMSGFWHGSMDLELTEMGRSIVAGTAAGLTLFALLNAWAGFHRGRRLLQLRGEDGNTVLVAPDTLEEQLEAVVLGSSQVEDAEVGVRRDGDHNVALDLELDIIRGAEVSAV